MRHRHVGDATSAEERACPVERAIDELVDQHEGAGRQLLLERAAGRERDQIGHARALQYIDVGAVVDVRGREPVARIVAREKYHRRARDLADAQRCRRLTPRTCDLLVPRLLEPRQIVNTGAADDPEHGFGHARKGSIVTTAMVFARRMGFTRADIPWVDVA